MSGKQNNVVDRYLNRARQQGSTLAPQLYSGRNGIGARQVAAATTKPLEPRSTKNLLVAQERSMQQQKGSAGQVITTQAFSSHGNLLTTTTIPSSAPGKPMMIELDGDDDSIDIEALKEALKDSDEQLAPSATTNVTS